MKTTPSRAIYVQAVAILFSAVVLLAAAAYSGPARADDCPALLKHSFNSLQTGKLQDLCQHKGKVVLVVNTASYCGYTDQYAGLEDLYRRYKDQGLVVLGFPTNDFGNQEPDNNVKIAKFCRLTYSVEFPMFEKSRVVGAERNSLYAELHKRTGVAPRWNFHKYLIDPAGEGVLSFESAVPPDDKRLVEEVRKTLDARKKLRRQT
jgi:glutathione peroxidase